MTVPDPTGPAGRPEIERPIDLTDVPAEPPDSSGAPDDDGDGAGPPGPVDGADRH